MNLATTALLFLLARRLFDTRVAAAAAATFAILSLSQGVLGVFAHATHFVLLPALAGTILLLRGLETRGGPADFLPEEAPMFRNIWRKWFERQSRAASRRPARPVVWMEVLEDRALPAVSANFAETLVRTSALEPSFGTRSRQPPVGVSASPVLKNQKSPCGSVSRHVSKECSPPPVCQSLLRFS